MKAGTTTAIFTAALLRLGGALAAAQETGPSSSQSPYIVPTAPGWGLASLLTVGDMAQTSPFVMAGIPDGLGAMAGKTETRSRTAAPSSWSSTAPPSSARTARPHGRSTT